MKFTVTFKTPDVLQYATADATDGEQQDIKRTVAKFVKFDELVTIEFDTQAQTAVVLPIK